MFIIQQLGKFCAALAGNWFSAMSGGLSVPLAIAAFFVPADSAKIILGCTAALCLFAAVFKAWDTENGRGEVAKAKLEAIMAETPTIELLFEENDSRYFNDIPSLYSTPMGRKWKIAVRNASKRKSADALTVRAKECWFVDCTIAEAHSKRDRGREKEPIILSLETLEPQAVQYVELFGVDWKPSNTPGDVLKRAHDFIIEARARDAVTVLMTLRYEPTEPPTLKRL